MTWFCDNIIGNHYAIIGDGHVIHSTLRSALGSVMTKKVLFFHNSTVCCHNKALMLETAMINRAL